VWIPGDGGRGAAGYTARLTAQWYSPGGE